MSIGAELAAARRQAGLNTAQVSQQTRIREPIIQAIERDDFSVCGADFYARGHIRAIAHAIGLDAEPLVAEYDARRGSAPGPGTPPRPGTTPGHGPPPAGAPGPPAPAPPSQRRKRAGAVALLIVLLAALGLVIYHAAGTPRAGNAAASTHRHATAHHAAHKHTASSAARHGARRMVISVTAVGQPCWAELATRRGATIFQGIIGPGMSRTWRERRAVTLRLGNPAAVRLRIDGRRHARLGSSPVTLSLVPGREKPG